MQKKRVNLKYKIMIAELPNVDPVLNIEPSKVEIGKKIIADCYTPGSDPPANITWYINYEKVCLNLNYHRTNFC